MRIFFDNCVSPRLARALAAFHEGIHEVAHIRTKYAELHDSAGRLDDDVWLAELARESSLDAGERAWIVVTEDLAILSKTARSGSARAAWERARLRTFFLPKGAKKPPLQQIMLLLRQWDRILSHAETMDPLHPVRIPESGVKFRRVE